MELEELVRNIQNARAATQADIAQLERELETNGRVAIHLVAARAVEAALSRIMGETRTLTDGPASERP